MEDFDKNDADKIIELWSTYMGFTNPPHDYRDSNLFYWEVLEHFSDEGGEFIRDIGSSYTSDSQISLRIQNGRLAVVGYANLRAVSDPDKRVFGEIAERKFNEDIKTYFDRRNKT